MSTIKDVAKAAGVSTATVSRAFEPEGIISPKTRAHIMKIADKMNYRPNLVARGLKRSRTQTVGIIIPSIDNHFYVDLLKHVEIALKQYHYRLIVSFIQHGVSDEREALASMAASQVDALLFSPRTHENREAVMKMSAQTAMLQLFTAPYPELDSLVMDDAGGVAMATRYLLDRGHTRIAYLGGDPRVEGFRKAYEERALVLAPELIALSWPSVEEAVVLIRQNHPTAVLAVSRQAEAAWNALQRLGLRIPEDISLLVYDDVNWVSMLGITAVAHQLDQIAEMAVNQLIYRLKENPGATAKPAPAKMTLMPFLRERGSVLDIWSDKPKIHA